MNSVEEIESAIEKLPEEDIARLREWLFDLDLQRDAMSGRLEDLAAEALAEHRLGRTKRL